MVNEEILSEAKADGGNGISGKRLWIIVSVVVFILLVVSVFGWFFLSSGGGNELVVLEAQGAGDGSVSSSLLSEKPWCMRGEVWESVYVDYSTDYIVEGIKRYDNRDLCYATREGSDISYYFRGSIIFKETSGIDDEVVVEAVEVNVPKKK